MTHNGLPTGRNRLLASLSPGAYANISSYLEPTTLSFRMRLESQNRNIDAMYFLESGIASIVAIGLHRNQAEVGLVGNEGVTGLPIIHRAIRSPCEVFIQVEGSGLKLPAERFSEVARIVPNLLDALLKYAHVLFVQAVYTSLANAHGRLEERLARWLLMAHDRVVGDELVLTHEFLSVMLGVRRSGVTVGLNDLEKRGMIATNRGSVIVLDRDALVEIANGLYGQAEAEYERLFPL